jgi:hypothetical protein
VASWFLTDRKDRWLIGLGVTVSEKIKRTGVIKDTVQTDREHDGFRQTGIRWHHDSSQSGRTGDEKVQRERTGDLMNADIKAAQVALWMTTRA